jgi:hypothetical protein
LNYSTYPLGTAFALSSIQQQTHSESAHLKTAAAERSSKGSRRGSTKMKVLGAAASFIGAITLMFAIIVAQIDYQHSWTAGAGTQTNVASATPSSAPERLLAAND